MNTRKMLIQENAKALQYLHLAHGFDFEKPHYLGILTGRFTYKMVTDLIRGQIGEDFTAAILVKIANRRYNERLHHAEIRGGKFQIDERRERVSAYTHDIDCFFGVGDFEETRKKKTELVYIIAQKTEYIRIPKAPVQLDGNTRYRIDTNAWRGGVTHCYDGRDNSYVSEIILRPTDGSREKVTFEPWQRYWPQEKRSDDIRDYIDKSGYIVRFRRLDLRDRAKALRIQHDAERLEKTDFSAREEKARADLAAVKRHLIHLIEAAETKEDGAEIRAKAYSFYYLLWNMEALKTRTFYSPEGKNGYFDGMENRAAEILQEVE